MLRSQCRLQFPLPFRVAYSFGNFGKGLVWNALEVFLLFYLVEFYDLAPSLAGGLIFFSLAIDALLSPWIGQWVDRAPPNQNRYAQLLLLAPPLAGLSFLLLLSPGLFDMEWRFTAAICGILTLRVCYALTDVPHNGLLSYFPIRSGVRTQLSSFRYFFSSAAALIVAAYADELLGDVAGANSPAGIPMFAATAATIFIVSLWLSIPPSYTARAHRGDLKSEGAEARILPKMLGTNVVRTYLVAAALIAIATTAFGKVLPFFAIYVAEDSTLVGTSLAALVIGKMFAMFIVNHRLMLTHRRHLMLAGCLFFALVSVAGFLVSITLGGLSLPFLSAGIGLATGLVVILQWSLSADLTDTVEKIHGFRSDGSLLASLTFVNKISIGLGVYALGLLLEYSLANDNSQGIEQVYWPISAAMLLWPAILMIPAFFLLRRLFRQLERSGWKE